MTRRWRLAEEGHVDVVLDAPPQQVWDVLTDVPRVGEWSHECRTATWIDGHENPVVGAVFVGGNQSGRTRWRRKCTVTESVAPRRWVYRTSGGVPRDSTEWRFELEALPDGGTRVRQSFRVLRLARAMEVAIYLLVPQHRDRREALRGDLVRLGRVAAVGSKLGSRLVDRSAHGQAPGEQHQRRGRADRQHGVPDEVVGEASVQPVAEQSPQPETRREQQP